MFHHCISFELFNLENRWRFDLFIINLKFLRMGRWGVQIPNKARPEILKEAGAYCEEYVRDATCMCATTCLPIQTVFCLAIKYWTQGSQGFLLSLLYLQRRRREILEFCVSQTTLIHLTLKAKSGPMTGYHPNSKIVRYTQETEIMFVTVGC